MKMGMGEGKQIGSERKEASESKACRKMEGWRSSVGLNSYSFKSYGGDEDSETYFSKIQFLVNICALQCKTVEDLTGFISCNN